MATQLILVRHGSIGEGWQGRYVGRTDPPLDETGTRQARALARALAGRGIERCFCSPLRRALDTAMQITRPMDRTATVEPDLREVDFGRWEGRTFDEIQKQDPALVDEWAKWDMDFSFPEGERITDFLTRAHALADRLAREEADTLLVVSHGGVIRSMLCHLLGMETRCYLSFEVSPASITALRLYAGKGVLTELNHRCHLES